jgi:hypothetical protein
MLAERDRIRLAEVFRLAEALGNRLWPDWTQAPFAVLLITPENEFLVRHPHPTPDFRSLGKDSLLKSTVYSRKTTFPTTFLATFPAVNGLPTIVLGQAENTEAKTSTPWLITLLHEHFHQLQYSQHAYYADVEALGLAKGDQSGMWMLNYPFPYDAPEVIQIVSQLCHQLAQTLQTRDDKELRTLLPAYLRTRKQLQQVLKPDDYKYLSFQLWQEGIARYTEYHVAAWATSHYKPSREFRQLADFSSIEATAQAIQERILNTLATVELNQAKRVAFYPLGAGEGLLLDRVNPKWQRRYFLERFDIGPYFDAIG